MGSTGSIGKQCLSVVESLPGRFGIVALAAGGNLEELAGQIERHKLNWYPWVTPRRRMNLRRCCEGRASRHCLRFTTGARECWLLERI